MDKQDTQSWNSYTIAYDVGNQRFSSMSFLENNLLRDLGRSLSRLTLALDEMLDSLFGQPRIFRSKPPRDDSENSDSTHDNRRIFNR